MHRLKNTLALRLTIWFLLLSFLPLGTMAIFVRRNVADTFLEMTAQHRYRHASTLASEISLLGDEADNEMVTQMLRAVSSKVDGVAFIVDENGAYVAHPDVTRVGSSAFNDFTTESVAQFLTGENGTIIEARTRRVIGYSAVPGQETIVVVVTDGTAISALMSDVERSSFVQLAVSLLLVSIAAGAVIWVVVGRPIRQLIEAADEIGDGNLGIEINPNDMEDELKLLAHTLNRMAKRLRELVNGLEQHVIEIEQAQEALRESEQKFRRIVELSNDGIVMTDERGMIIEWNAAQERITGLKWDEVSGQPLWDVQFRVSPEGRNRSALYQQIKASLLRFLETGRAPWLDQLQERIIQRPDGIRRTVQAMVFSIETERGFRAASFSRDVTERVRVEDLIRAQRDLALQLGAALGLEETLRLCTEAAVQGTGMDSGGIYLVDPASGELNKLFPQELSPDFIAATFHHDADVPSARLVMAGQPVYINYQELDMPQDETREREGLRAAAILPIHHEGQVIACLHVASRSLDEIPATTRDTLEMIAAQTGSFIARARAEEELRHYAARLETMREIDQAILAARSPEEIAQSALRHIRQLVPCQLASVALFDFVASEYTRIAVHINDTMQVAVGTRAPLENMGDLEPLRRGEIRIIENITNHTSQPLPLAMVQALRTAGVRFVVNVPLLVQGELIGMLNMGATGPGTFSQQHLDIAREVADQLAIAIQNTRLHQEIQRHADELAAAVTRLEELDRLKSEFIQNVSHELRTPLALVRGYAELLDTGELGELSPQQQKSVEIIARRTRMLSSLVDDITLILEVENRQPAREPVKIGELARAAVADFRVTADQAGLALRSEIGSGLPLVGGNVGHLRRVLDNLLGNAVKFTPPGGTITVRVRSEKERVILQVADTGIGIPPDQQERIFERFYQVNGSASRKYGGVGLGLALVKEIVAANGGQIHVESQEGAGSTFTVIWPAFKAEETE